MIQRVNHVQITIPKGSEDAAREFYCKMLGLIEVEKPEALKSRGGLWMTLDGFPIHIGTEDGIERSSSKAHVAYEVSDLDSWRKRLEGNRIEILDGIPIPNFRRFEFRDPFGNRVEFLEKVD